MILSWAFIVDSVPFTKAVVDGKTSLGGSESACLGLARALRARGHEVHVFATHLSDDARGADAAGVFFHPAESFYEMNQFMEWDVVCALRSPMVFNVPVHARLRLLWNQDLLLPDTGKMVMAIAWALDHAVYVSDYHRRQWEGLQPELAPIGWATKNGFDAALVPATSNKDPFRVIHISRPERGLEPLLAMWPELKRRVPQATLQICRYASMYDGEGSNVRAMCESFDALVAAVQQKVGGITYLGALAKPALYQAIADAAVMWYPGIDTFAETSCIAAVEAQACGTPFVGSWKGALPETVPSGILVRGDAMSPAYQAESIAAVERLLQDCRGQSFRYRHLVKQGRAHVEGYTYAAIAAEWEAFVEGRFEARYKGNKLGVLRQLLHEDDHCAADVVASDIIVPWTNTGEIDIPPAVHEACDAKSFCQRVIAGLEQGAEDYAAHAIQDPLDEVKASGRFQAVAPLFAGCRRVLDVACGNGSGAIALLLAHPELHVVGIDYAAANIASAYDAAIRAGVADRVTFACGPIWDLPQNQPAELMPCLQAVLAGETNPFDGLFVGEFVEHVADCHVLVDFLETFLAEGAVVAYTCPTGPFGELVPRGQPIQRGHVHCFKHDDIKTVWGQKQDLSVNIFGLGLAPRGTPIGQWILSYRTAPDRPARPRDLAGRATRTRPQPRVSVGLITKNAALDLARCLASVWPIADEIVIGDTGSTDETLTIAAQFGARVLHLAPLEAQPEGFAGARNAVLQACTGDWFLWIDADEVLIGARSLCRYIEGAVFHGFVVHQNHLYLEATPTFDIPVRLFRRRPDIRFYGCIHEQPQQGGPNDDIYPTLEALDLQIAHTGYLTHDVREQKRVERNLPLLVRDRHVFPERLLGKVLLIREAVIQADSEVDRAGGLTVRARAGYEHAIALFVQHFDDPAHKFRQIVRPWYEAALRHLGLGWEMEIAIAGKPGGLNQTHARPERVWVRDHAELQRLIAHQLAGMVKPMSPPAPLHTDPFVDAPAAAEHAEAPVESFEHLARAEACA